MCIPNEVLVGIQYTNDKDEAIKNGGSFVRSDIRDVTVNDELMKIYDITYTRSIILDYQSLILFTMYLILRFRMLFSSIRTQLPTIEAWAVEVKNDRDIDLKPSTVSFVFSFYNYSDIKLICSFVQNKFHTLNNF